MPSQVNDMTAISPTDLQPTVVRPQRLIASVLLLLLLGFMSFAAVRELKADRSNEYLVADHLAGMKFLLPEGVQPILSGLGLMPSECK
jgi:hypothetical protein